MKIAKLHRTLVEAILVSSISFLCWETEAQTTQKSQEAFRRNIQTEFNKKSLRANRHIVSKATVVMTYRPLLSKEDVTGPVELDVETVISGSTQVEYYGSRFLVSKTRVAEADISRLISKGEQVAIRKVDFGKEGVTFEVESANKSKGKLKFESETFIDNDPEVFKERIVSHFFYLERYEPFRLLHMEYQELSDKVRFLAMEAKAGSDYEKRLSAVREILGLLRKQDANRQELATRKGTDLRMERDAIARDIQTWTTALLSIREQKWQQEIGDHMVGLEDIHDLGLLGTRKSELELRIQREIDELTSAGDLSESEKKTLRSVLDQYRAQLRDKVEMAHQRRLRALDDELAELKASHVTRTENFKNTKETNKAQILKKMEIAGELTAIVDQMRQNRQQYGEFGGTVSQADLLRWEKESGAWRAAQQKLNAQANAAELKKLDAEYSSLLFDYTGRKAQGQAAARSAMDLLSRMEANRQTALSLGSQKAEEQLRKIRSEKQLLQK